MISFTGADSSAPIKNTNMKTVILIFAFIPAFCSSQNKSLNDSIIELNEQVLILKQELKNANSKIDQIKSRHLHEKLQLCLPKSAPETCEGFNELEGENEFIHSSVYNYVKSSLNKSSLDLKLMIIEKTLRDEESGRYHCTVEISARSGSAVTRTKRFFILDENYQIIDL